MFASVTPGAWASPVRPRPPFATESAAAAESAAVSFLAHAAMTAQCRPQQ